MANLIGATEPSTSQHGRPANLKVTSRPALTLAPYELSAAKPISLYPMIVPHHFTLRLAASPARTQAFLPIGTLVLLPVILMYTGWSYWVFRGKTHSDIGYH